MRGKSDGDVDDKEDSGRGGWAGNGEQIEV